jgi:uncharacterized protein YcbX
MSVVRVAALHVYPIKSCAGIAVDTMRFDALGPLDDRRWMLVDDDGEFLTQREVPSLATVRPSRVEGGGLRVFAPGMPVLDVAGHGGDRRAAYCWDDRCAGFDEGDAARAWFSAVVGRRVRLLRFDATAPRVASRNWVGDAVGRPGALTRFSDGFPLLVTALGSLEALNARLAGAGLPEASMARFRPNVVLDGLAAFEEDLVGSLVSPGGVVLRLVKPCTRCTITEVDPRNGRHAPGLLGVLASFRADPRLGGAVTFGRNAIVAGGLDVALRVGEPLEVVHRRA